MSAYEQTNVYSSNPGFLDAELRAEMCSAAVEPNAQEHHYPQDNLNPSNNLRALRTENFSTKASMALRGHELAAPLYDAAQYGAPGERAVWRAVLQSFADILGALYVDIACVENNSTSALFAASSTLDKASHRATVLTNLIAAAALPENKEDRQAPSQTIVFVDVSQTQMIATTQDLQGRQMALFAEFMQHLPTLTCEQHTFITTVLPHVVRAINCYLMTATAATHASILDCMLEQAHTGIVLLNKEHLIVEMNTVARHILARKNALEICDQRLRCLRLSEDDKLQALIEAAAKADHHSWDTHTLSLPQKAYEPPLGVAIRSTRIEHDHRLNKQPAVLVMLHDRNHRMDIPEPLLRGSYGLTAAEAKLAANLARGLSLQEAAAAAKVSKETVRKHLRSVFEKTGTNRQSQLIAQLHQGIEVYGCAP